MYDVGHEMKWTLLSMLNKPIEAMTFLEMLQSIHVDQFVSGYAKILRDKLLDNKLADVQCINELLPEFLNKRIDTSSTYILADLLPPGGHQYIVFNPVDDTVWVKDFVVGTRPDKDLADFQTRLQ